MHPRHDAQPAAAWPLSASSPELEPRRLRLSLRPVAILAVKIGLVLFGAGCLGVGILLTGISVLA